MHKCGSFTTERSLRRLRCFASGPTHPLRCIALVRHGNRDQNAKYLVTCSPTNQPDLQRFRFRVNFWANLRLAGCKSTFRELKTGFIFGLTHNCASSEVLQVAQQPAHSLSCLPAAARQHSSALFLLLTFDHIRSWKAYFLCIDICQIVHIAHCTGLWGMRCDSADTLLHVVYTSYMLLFTHYAAPQQAFSSAFLVISYDLVLQRDGSACSHLTLDFNKKAFL